MHELTITESILEIALKHAQNAHANRITDLYLVVGQLSSIVDESVQFYWDIIADGTIAEGAKLHFQREPIEIVCLDCGRQYIPPDGQMACPDCEGVNIRILSGEQFFLEAIDVDTKD